MLTDIEGSTRLWEQHPEPMRDALVRHEDVVAEVVAKHQGHLIRSRGEGDSCFAVFSTAATAVATALEVQRTLGKEQWPEPISLRVRIGVHSGEAELRDGDYYGSAVNKCARLRAAAHGGQVLISATTADLLNIGLFPDTHLRDLGVKRLRDIAEPERIFQLCHPDLVSDFPPLLAVEDKGTNLRTELTSFVGRDREIAEVKDLLADHRLVTLAGAGGCGKTRLAVEVARQFAPDYPDGAWLIDLGRVTDSSAVPEAIAAELGQQEGDGSSGTPTERLVQNLRNSRTLLILDNCEHLLDACAATAESVLRGCRDVTILATSRESLNASGEATLRVPSLSTPEERLRPSVEELLQYDAVRLFADRARLIRSQFEVTAANADPVAEICRRLDGMPLAIELAAARVNALSVEQIAARLSDQFRLLTGGSRTAVSRQQTLKATVDWSYQLLDAEERLLFGRLAVFVGGFTLEATEEICSEAPLTQDLVLDVLTRLVDKSLVIANPLEPTGPRFRLLEPVRHYARDKMLESGTAADLHGRHRDWFLALAERAEPEMTGPDQAQWMAVLAREIDNLRAALEWSLTTSDDRGLRFCAALWRFWRARGLVTEGRRSTAQALQSRPADATSHRARALYGASNLARTQGDHDSALALAEQALRVADALGDRSLVALSLNAVGLVSWAQQDYAVARATFEKMLALVTAATDRRGVATALGNLGLVEIEVGDYARARPFLDRALEVFRELGDRRYIATTLLNLADTSQALGEYAAAIGLAAEGLGMARDLEDVVTTVLALKALGEASLALGELDDAGNYLGEAREKAAEAGDRRNLGRTLRALAALARAAGDRGRAAELELEATELAADLGDRQLLASTLESVALVEVPADPLLARQLFAVASSLRAATGNRLPPSEEAAIRAARERLQLMLGAEGVDGSSSTAADLTIDEAVAAVRRRNGLG